MNAKLTNKIATTMINKHVQNQIPKVFEQIRDALIMKVKADQIDYNDLTALEAYLSGVEIDPIKVSSFAEELF